MFTLQTVYMFWKYNILCIKDEETILHTESNLGPRHTSNVKYFPLQSNAEPGGQTVPPPLSLLLQTVLQCGARPDRDPSQGGERPH